MRRSNFVLVLMVVLWIGGCQEKLPVELALDQSTNALEVQVLPPIDTTLIVEASVDTSGVSQSEEQLYPGTILMNGVKTDLGDTPRSSFSYSRILLNDTRSSITSGSKVIGYLGMDVGVAKVNSVDLPKTYRPVRTYTSFQPNFNAGPAYFLIDADNKPVANFSYVPGQTYRFVADGKGAVAPFQLGIQSPEEITVVEPKAGSIALRSQDLQIHWNGKSAASFRVLISSFNAQSNVAVKPLVEIAVTEGSNSITLPSKLLKGLQANSDGRYLFSFISSNRSIVKIAGYDGDVLVQAASIHNILLRLM
jgi:hypothetical protein